MNMTLTEFIRLSLSRVNSRGLYEEFVKQVAKSEYEDCLENEINLDDEIELKYALSRVTNEAYYRINDELSYLR